MIHSSLSDESSLNPPKEGAASFLVPRLPPQWAPELWKVEQTQGETCGCVAGLQQHAGIVAPCTA